MRKEFKEEGMERKEDEWTDRRREKEQGSKKSEEHIRRKKEYRERERSEEFKEEGMRNIRMIQHIRRKIGTTREMESESRDGK